MPEHIIQGDEKGMDYIYSTEALLGKGAFGTVFRGNEDQTNRPVAIKRIDKRGNDHREIDLLEDLKHPNIVQLINVSYSKKYIYLITEYCNGGDYNNYLAQNAPLSLQQIVMFLNNIVPAMKVLNEKGIIHRDLKPANILCHISNAKRRYFKIADFGIARLGAAYDECFYATRAGTERYMAPEVRNGRSYNSKADMYSLGVILAELPVENADELPDSVRELALLLTMDDPQLRLSAEDFFNHSFIREYLDGSDEETDTTSESESEMTETGSDEMEDSEDRERSEDEMEYDSETS